MSVGLRRQITPPYVQYPKQPKRAVARYRPACFATRFAPVGQCTYWSPRRRRCQVYLSSRMTDVTVSRSEGSVSENSTVSSCAAGPVPISASRLVRRTFTASGSGSSWAEGSRWFAAYLLAATKAGTIVGSPILNDAAARRPPMAFCRLGGTTAAPNPQATRVEQCGNPLLVWPAYQFPDTFQIPSEDLG